MSAIKDAWEKQRLDYQGRYVKACVKLKESLDNNRGIAIQERYGGAMLEMSWVLCNIFGLSGKQVEEVERNAGFTNADVMSH